MKYYFAAKRNFDGVMLWPRVPQNKYDSEDNEIERICVSQSINGCLTAVGCRFGVGDEVFIHECESNNVMQPTTDQVVDACFTGEMWILEAVTMKLFMKVTIMTMVISQVNNDLYNTTYAIKIVEEE